jgi:hypothetical protein
MARRPRYTEEQVRDAVRSARSFAEALRRLGLRPAGGNHLTLKKLIARYGLSIEHFDPYSAQRGHRTLRPAMPLELILVEHSTYSRNHLKRRLYDAGLKSRVCEMCGQGEEWHGRPMAMILDHVNGVPTDNRLENLQIVCPNCAATLDTHCGRKNRRDRRPRNCLWCGGEFIPKYSSHRYCSPACGNHSRGPREPRPERRKVERPSYDQLMVDVGSMSFVAVGRKYGVSDNAVRKWIRWYEYEREMEQTEETGEQDARTGKDGA